MCVGCVGCVSLFGSEKGWGWVDRARSLLASTYVIHVPVHERLDLGSVLGLRLVPEARALDPAKHLEAVERKALELLERGVVLRGGVIKCKCGSNSTLLRIAGRLAVRRRTARADGRESGAGCSCHGGRGATVVDLHACGWCLLGVLCWGRARDCADVRSPSCPHLPSAGLDERGKGREGKLIMSGGKKWV